MLMNTYNKFKIAFEKGKGSYLYDENNKGYLDFVTGIAVNCLGHCHPKLIGALEEQGKNLWHVSNIYEIKEQQKLAEKLVSLSGLDGAFFCNSGTEAVEAALKLAKKYAKINGHENKNEVIAMKNSFHGRTLGALSLTGQTKYQKDFTPLIPNIKYAEFNNIEDVKSKINENTAAIILELIQGEGGIHGADKEFVQEIRKICDEKQIAMIVDEVQTGIGRTGKMFAFQHYGILPDMVSLAKALGGGFPIGAMLARKDFATTFVPGDHASTFGGNPLACKIANTVLDTIKEENILNHVCEMEQLIKEKLTQFKDLNLGITKIKGKGFLIGVEVSQNIKDVIQKCMEKGLLILGAGEKTLRMVPPLNVSKKEIEEAMDIFKKALEETL